MSVRDSTSNKTIMWVNIAFSGTFFVVIFSAIFFLSAKISHLEIENSALKTEVAIRKETTSARLKELQELIESKQENTLPRKKKKEKAEEE